MWKNKELFFKLSIYSVLSYLFLAFVPSKQANLNILYTDFYLFILVLLVYSNYILKYKYNLLEISRFKKMKNYIVFKILQFSKLNIFISLWIMLSNVLVMYLCNMKMNYFVVFYYTINFFLIFEVLYYICFLIELVFKKKGYSYLAIFIFLGMYIIEIMSIKKNPISFNIFSTCFLPSNFFYFILNYSAWFVLPSILFYSFKEEVEL